MAKEKLFTPEDFDKEPKAQKDHYWRWVVAVIIVIIAIIALVFGLRSCESDNNSQNPESPQAAIVNDSTTDSAVLVVPDSVDTNVVPQDETSSNKMGVNNKKHPSKDASEQVQRTSKSIDVSSDVEVEALKVIRGDYGNNPDRKSNLGNKYQSIQNRVNELKRQGAF